MKVKTFLSNKTELSLEINYYFIGIYFLAIILVSVTLMI